MSSLLVSSICAICIFGGAILGMALRSWLPTHHLKDESKDTVKVGAGMIATMAALVLGLLVGSAKDSFDTMNTEVTQSAAKIILLDRLFANYGPETADLRALLRKAVETGLQSIWPEQTLPEGSEISALERINYMEAIQKKMFDLSPSIDAQKQLLGQAQQTVGELRSARWLIIEQAQNGLPGLFLVIVVFWLTMLHMSFGLFAPRNGTVIAVLLICSLSVSSALFLIFELSHPLHGLVKVSGAPMRSALDHLGK